MYIEELYYQYVHSETFIEGTSSRYFILKETVCLVFFMHLQLDSSLVTCSVHFITSRFSSVKVRWGPLEVLL